MSSNCSRRRPSPAPAGQRREHAVLPDAARVGGPRRAGTTDIGSSAHLRPAHTRGDDRPLQHRVPARARPAGRLPQRTPARPRLQQLGNLGQLLGNRFWADLEAHHPGIDSLHLAPDVADAWKQRLRRCRRRSRPPPARPPRSTVPRLSYRECLTPVRALYLDLAHWAVEDPGRWARWVAPCPIGDSEIDLRKGDPPTQITDGHPHPSPPTGAAALVAAVDQRRKQTAAVLEAARRAQPGETFTVPAGSTFDPAGPGDGRLGARLDQPASPATCPSKRSKRSGRGRSSKCCGPPASASKNSASSATTASCNIGSPPPASSSRCCRSPRRRPTPNGSWSSAPNSPTCSPPSSAGSAAPAAPCRSSRPTTTTNRSGRRPRHGCSNVASTPRTGRSPTAPCSRSSTAALARTGLTDSIDGHPLHYTPHDFRRMFITDAILNGLPPHIAQIIAGHRDINVTLGYKAVYPEEAIQAHLGFLARRRSLRPSEEYRVPTDEEWQQFLGHFERRKVSIGTCARAFSTPCIHEHACVRCSMLWPDPPNEAGSSRSATTSPPASPKPNARAGPARSKDSRSASPAPRQARPDRQPTAAHHDRTRHAHDQAARRTPQSLTSETTVNAQTSPKLLDFLVQRMRRSSRNHRPHHRPSMSRQPQNSVSTDNYPHCEGRPATCVRDVSRQDTAEIRCVDSQFRLTVARRPASAHHEHTSTGSLGQIVGTPWNLSSSPKFPLIAPARTPSQDCEQGFCALEVAVA